MDEMREFRAPVGGYGRIWESMYHGSMVGAGPEVFCLWPYVIANMRVGADGSMEVLLNPELLAAVFGSSREFVVLGVERLCGPDVASKNGLAEEGRRLVHLAGYLYRVVNGAEYQQLRAKEAHAAAQARYRERRRGKRGGRSVRSVQADNDARERRYVAAVERGDELGAEAVAAEGLPDGLP